MSEFQQDLVLLAKDDCTLSQIMTAIGRLEQLDHKRRISVGLSSSVTIDLLGVYLRKYSLLAGVHMSIVQGNYDDPIGDVDLFLNAGVDQMVLIPSFDNLMPSFEAQLGLLDNEAISAKEEQICTRYHLALNKAAKMSTVFLATFHRMGTAMLGDVDLIGSVVIKFNQALRNTAAAFPNVRMIDSDEIIRGLGQKGAYDPRFYFRNKAPYSGSFLNELARRIALSSRGFGTTFHKVLVLDCDNTLWGGVIGEDLVSGIKLGPYDYPGNIFWRVQHEFAALERNGILLCICSKNNPVDVEEAILHHPDMVLRNDQFVVKKINWNDKPANLRAIAEELNLGLDSMVFLDDSTFECESVRQQLPMVTTIQVPAMLSDYPQTVAGIKDLFLAGGISSDASTKTQQYRQRAGAEELKAQFGSQDDYLASLGISVELSRNARASLVRISELSMKSNQFNLTTRRYPEAELLQAMQDPQKAVYSLVVADKFGNAGLTGVAVLRYEGTSAIIENFLMSCRVIGRGVEMAIWDQISSDAAMRGCQQLLAKFSPSAKNAQVTDFYDRLGLDLITATSAGVKRYAIAIKTFKTPATPWIKLNYVE
jgi:FkbH-like protein